MTSSTTKHLGIIVGVAEVGADAQQRITAGWKTYRKYNRLWRNTRVSAEHKVRLMESLVIPVVLYGCEIWHITARVRRSLGALEYRMLTDISRFTTHTEDKPTWHPRNREGTWHWPKREVMRQETPQAGRLDLVARAEFRQRMWLGHVLRLREDPQDPDWWPMVVTEYSLMGEEPET